MYVRFNAVYRTETKEVYGIFSIAGYLFDNSFLYPGNLNTEDERRLRELNDWFRYNLKLPTKVWRGKNHSTQPTAVSWFKDTAHEHIRNLREISNIIQRYGVIVEFVRTEKPGYILYEDEYQVFAEPFKD